MLSFILMMKVSIEDLTLNKMIINAGQANKLSCVFQTVSEGRLLNMCNIIQVTKWLTRSDLLWCTEEVERITEKTGDKCKVMNGGKGKEDKIAVVRWVKD